MDAPTAPPGFRRKRPRRSTVAVVPAASLPLLIAACTGHMAAGNATPLPASPRQPAQETTMQDTQAIKRGIDELLAADLGDIASLNQLLGADLELAPSSNPYFVVRRSATGALGGLPARSVELRSSKDDPKRALISIQLAEPTGNAEAFVRSAWPDAEFAPARPNAADSGAYWTAHQGEAKVIVGQPPGGGAIASIAIDRIP